MFGVCHICWPDILSMPVCTGICQNFYSGLILTDGTVVYCRLKVVIVKVQLNAVVPLSANVIKMYFLHSFLLTK